MKFFRSLLASHSFSTTDFSTPSSHTDTIDHAAQTAMSTALSNYVQATAAIAAPTFDAKPFDASEPVHVVASTVPQTFDFHSFAHNVLAPVVRVAPAVSVAPVVVQAVEVDKAAALDAVHAQVVERAHTALADATHSDVAHSADAIAVTHQIATASTVGDTTIADVVGHSTAKVEAVATAAQATIDTAQIDASGSVIQFIPTNTAAPRTLESHSKDHLFAPWKPDSEPAPESVLIAKTVDDSDSKIDSHVSSGSTEPVSILQPADDADRWANHSMFSVHKSAAFSTMESHNASSGADIGTPDGATNTPQAVDPTEIPTAVVTLGEIPLPEVADGADHWENHSMFSVKPPECEESSEITWEKEVVDAVGVTPHWTDTFWEDGSCVTDPMAHGIIGTVISVCAAPSETGPVAGCYPASFTDETPYVPVVFQVDVEKLARAVTEETPDIGTVESKTANATPETTSLPELMDGADRWENHSTFSVGGPDEDTVTASESVTVEPAKIDTTEATTTIEGKDALQAPDLVADFWKTWTCNLPVSTEELRNHPIAEFILPPRSNEGSAAQVLDVSTYDVVATVLPSLVATEQYAVV